MQDPRIVQIIADDVEHYLYISEDWSVEFYETQAYEGFIATSYDDHFLLPEMQREYCTIDLTRAAFPMGRSLTRKLKKRFGRSMKMTFSRDFDGVLDGIATHHAKNWMGKKYRELISLQQRTGEIIKFVSVELRTVNEELVAGEIGYVIGATYTSLTGFSRRDGNCSLGSVQLKFLGKILQEAGFKLWNLGHPPRENLMKYKIDLGGVVVSRAEFLKEWRRFREEVDVKELRDELLVVS